MAFDLSQFVSVRTSVTVGHPLDFAPSVGSTMDVARQAGRDGQPHGYVALADEQTAGRGRFGRRWVAPPASNLLFTILVRPTSGQISRLSIIAALAVGDAVAEVLPAPPSFKWPNDVLVDGRKLAGILVEAEFVGSEPTFALVGIGLNVNAEMARQPDVAETAVSIRDLLGHPVAREPLLARLLTRFERWYGERSDVAVLEAWSARLETLGRTISVRFGDTVEYGIAEAVTPTGALLLRRADGSVIELPAGEVTTRISR